MQTTGIITRQEARTASFSATADVYTGYAPLMIFIIVIETPYGEVEYVRLSEELSKWPVGTEVQLDLKEEYFSIFGWVLLRWWVATAVR